MFREEESLQLSDRNSILMTGSLSGIRSEALIGQQSSHIVSAVVYEWQKDKRQKATKVKCKHHESIGGSHTVSGDTNNNGEMNKCWWTNKTS